MLMNPSIAAFFCLVVSTSLGSKGPMESPSENLSLSLGGMSAVQTP